LGPTSIGRSPLAVGAASLALPRCGDRSRLPSGFCAGRRRAAATIPHSNAKCHRSRRCPCRPTATRPVYVCPFRTSHFLFANRWQKSSQTSKRELCEPCRVCAHLHADSALSRVLSLSSVPGSMPGREVRVRAKTPGGVWKEWREEEERSERGEERSEGGRGRCGQAPVATANSGSTKEASGRRRGESFHSPSSRAADQEGRGAPALYRARSAPAGAGSSL
jgi:hypothetical protein